MPGSAPAPCHQRCYLLLDQGGHASRALIYDGAGRLLSEGRAVLAARGGDLCWEYDPKALLRSLREAMHSALATLGDDAPPVAAAGLATQRANTACWDRRDGTPLAPVIAWQDRRATDLFEALDAGQHRLIREITGLAPSPHYGAGKLRWYLERVPAVRRARRDGRLAMGPMAAFLVRRLTREGHSLVDPVNASRTLLWDLRRRTWSAPLLALFGIPADVLPGCVPTCHDFGRLQGGEAAPPLRVVTGDQAAALFARGRPDTETACITLGTGAFVLQPVGPEPVTCQGLLSSIIQAAPSPLYALEGTVNGAGNALRWFERHTARSIDYEQLDVLLAEDDDAPLFLNGIGGLGTPFMQPDLPSRFIGGGDHDRRLVALVDSILFLLQLNLERLSEAASEAGHPAPRRIEVGGGLARLDHFCRRLAALSGLPVERCRDHETTARGLLYQLAEACDAPPPQPPPVDHFAVHPRPRLKQRYGRWKRLLYDAVRDGDRKK